MMNAARPMTIILSLLFAFAVARPARTAEDPASKPAAKAASKDIEAKKQPAEKPSEPAWSEPKKASKKAEGKKSKAKSAAKSKSEEPKPKAEKSEPVAEKAKPAETDSSSKKEASTKKATETAKPAETAKAEKPAKKSPEKPAEKKTFTLARIALRGSFPEGPELPGLFSEVRPSLLSVVRRMDQLVEEKSVGGVLLEISDLEIGQGKANELRTAIARLRKAGKPVYAELTSAETPEYLVAAACDQIALAPSGMLMIPGVRAEVTFYKGLLDKLGIQYDGLQMGKYKGAGETYTRTGMSPALRVSMEAMVDDVYQALVATIAKDRLLEDDHVKELIEQGLFTASAAKKAGLIDHVAYRDELLDAIRKKHHVDEIKFAADARKKAAEVEPGITGVMKMMEAMMGGKSSPSATANRKIALVYAVGPIYDGESGSTMFGDRVLGGRTLVSALRTAAEDPKVLAIVLRVDSPGGSAVASDLVWREIQGVKKPVIASLGDVAASGGYYIAMGTSKVIAEPGTVTGSIGVVGGKLVMGGLYEKVGITTEIISRGRNSGSLSSNQPFTREQREAWTTLLRETYRQFVDKAAQGRKMPREKLEQLAQGRVYTGRMAAANGLIDRIGTLHDALAEAKKAAGLKPEEKVEVLVLPRPRSFFEQFFAEADVTSRLAASMPPGAELLLRAELLRRLFAEPILTLMPFEVKLN